MTYKDIYEKYIKIAKSKNLEKEAIRYIISEMFLNGEDYYLNKDAIISPSIEKKIELELNRYVENYESPQYIVGHTFFYGRKYFINKNVLIPRFDTEILIDVCLEEIKKIKKESLNIIDIGTGSGIIAITLKKEIPALNVFALDISPDSIKLSKKNANYHKADITIIESDILKNCNVKDFDIIVSNPPYISYNEEIEKLVYDNEPHLALFADNDGMQIYERILKESKSSLNEKNIIIFEIAYNKENEIKKLAKKYYDKAKLKIIHDLNNNPRVIVIDNL